MKTILGVIIILLSLSAGQGQRPNVIETEKVRGIICTNFDEWRREVESKEFWTPTREQVLKAEQAIEQYLKRNPPPQSKELWRKLPRYKRQYLGIVVNGQKRIFCNFYCTDDPLRETPVIYMDGGDCFFQIEYGVADQKCYRLMINGEA